MSSSVEAYVRYRIANAPLLTFPFPHFFIRDIFPDDFYTSLISYLPDQEFFNRTARAIAVPQDGYKERSICSLKDLENNHSNAQSALFWQSISSWMLSKNFSSLIAEKFEDTLIERFGVLGEEQVVSEARMVLDRKNYAIGPHTDAQQKLVSLLFYLPRDTGHAHLGTSIYIPNDPDFACAGGPHYNFDGFTKVVTMPYVPNSLLAFAKTDQSFHGVERIQDDGIERHVLLYNLYVKQSALKPTTPRQPDNSKRNFKFWWRK